MIIRMSVRYESFLHLFFFDRRNFISITCITEIHCSYQLSQQPNMKHPHTNLIQVKDNYQA